MFHLFKRLNQVLAANLNDLIDRVADPERMIKHILREVEENIRLAEAGVVDALNSEKQLYQEIEAHCRESQAWRQRAIEALSANREDMARTALTCKKEHDQIIRALELSWHVAHQACELLKAQLHALEAKFVEAQRQYSTIMARQQAVRKRRQAEQSMANIRAGGHPATDVSYAGDVPLALSQQLSEPVQKSDDVAVDPEIEKELDELKKKLASSSVPLALRGANDYKDKARAG